MSEQDSTQSSALQHPANDDKESWISYWRAQGQSWRTEPEIDVERQKYLAERHSIKPDIEQSIYPFKDIKLNRADIEWLLATHEDRLKPADWGYEEQRVREELDLREVNLSGLTLTNANLAKTNLYMANLEGAKLNNAQLEGANLRRANLEGGVLDSANLREASLENANLEQAFLLSADLERADLVGAQLKMAILDSANLAGANLLEANLEAADLRRAHLVSANFQACRLGGANLLEANLAGANFQGAHLEGANLHGSNLSGANFQGAHLEGANLSEAYLAGTRLNGAFFSSSTDLKNVILGNDKYGFASLAGVHWGDVDLSVIDWYRVKVLGDEIQARRLRMIDGTNKDLHTRLEDYQVAVRANRQLAIALQAQGLNEEAARFAYRAQVLQRVVLRRKMLFGPLIFSLFLDILAGYGYRPMRSILWYLFIIFGFAIAYSAYGHLPLLPDAFIFSLTSFHGRGFFPGLSGETSLHNPIVVLSALEAVVGLFIEISFIATFTQRFFGK